MKLELRFSEQTVRRLEEEFDEYLAQVSVELTPEQARRIIARIAAKRRASGLLPGAPFHLLPSNS